MTQFGNKISPNEDIYKMLRTIAPEEGSKVRISIPGLPWPFVTEVTYVDETGKRNMADAPGVYLGDRFYFLGDRANGFPNHNWSLEFEIVSPTRGEQFEAMKIGQTFSIGGHYKYVKVSDAEFAALNDWGGTSTLWNYKDGMNTDTREPLTLY
jgi:hypothetical protein